jgi:hypothetical protein
MKDGRQRHQYGDAWVNGLEHQSFNQEVMRPWVQIPAEPVIKIEGKRPIAAARQHSFLIAFKKHDVKHTVMCITS